MLTTDSIALTNPNPQQLVSNVFTGSLDYQRQSALQNSAYELEKALRDTQYTSTFNQLRAEGINPYTALGSFGGASAPSVGTPSAGKSGQGFRDVANLAMTALSLATKTASAQELAELKASTALEIADIRSRFPRKW